MLMPGLYEQGINTKLQSELAEIPQIRKETAPIDRAEASRVLSQYLTNIVQKGLDNVLDNGGDIAAQVALTNQIVTLIQTSTQEADFAALSVAEQAEQFLAFLREADPRLATGKTALPDLDKRMLQMFYVTVWGKAVEDWSADEALDNLYGLADSQVMRSELMELLRYQYDHIDFIDALVDWALTAHWICTTPTPATNCWWLWTF